VIGGLDIPKVHLLGFVGQEKDRHLSPSLMYRRMLTMVALLLAQLAAAIAAGDAALVAILTALLVALGITV
jgi:hypothetical protein